MERTPGPATVFTSFKASTFAALKLNEPNPIATPTAPMNSRTSVTSATSFDRVRRLANGPVRDEHQDDTYDDADDPTWPL